MAVIYLRHPIHGEKVACGDHEAKMDCANGWVIFDPNVKPEPVAAPEPVEEPVVPDFLSAAPAPKIRKPKL